MEETFITITGLKFYKMQEELKVGTELVCLKDHENKYDQDAIGVVTEDEILIGYIANSPYTVAKGTKSASRIYDSIGEAVYVEIIFVLKEAAICKLIDKPTDSYWIEDLEYVFEEF